MTKKTAKLLASTILVEFCDAQIIRCTARVAFTFNGLHIEEGAQYFLAQSSEDTSRYYVVAWYERGAEWSCSCGTAHKFTGHHRAVKAWVLQHVVRPREQEILARPVARWAGFYSQPAPSGAPAQSTVDQELDEILAEIDAAKPATPVTPAVDIAERGSFHSRGFSMVR